MLLVALGPSYNQPKISLCATWNSNARTLANTNVIGVQPFGVFVDVNNIIYVTATSLNRVQIWFERNNTPAKTISNGLSLPAAVFATINGDIYVDNGAVNHRVEKWSLNATTGIIIMNVTSRCRSLFVDTNDILYCSNDLEHKVVKMSLSSGSNTVRIAAGNGTAGSQANMLYSPNGIFVDKNFNLYVADWGNNRIQLFQPGQLNATTVAGSGAPSTITLYYPSAVLLDANNYLFISDYNNHRIIRSGPFGFHCLLGCTGAASDQLNRPYGMSFDSYGNLFVVDINNNRIQKFLLAINSCGR